MVDTSSSLDACTDFTAVVNIEHVLHFCIFYCFIEGT